ncbi:hypothetical protein [Streptomyces jumonjinensis]|uniref:hypothetical protein n=1 Tax=Streptomyces jumonjinensis TaxID=1945 RepID=UPI0037BA47A8
MSTGVSGQGDSPAETSAQHDFRTFLRFPDIRQPTWYRIAELAYYRGLLPETKFRLAKFLNLQRLGRTGRVEGRFDSDQVDGGEALAERYADRFKVGTDRFWDDLRGLYRSGFGEQVVKPAPGRRAVYALCLRADAIPSDLPDDLMQELRVWDLPEPVDPHEDAAYGRLTSRQAPAVEPFVVAGLTPETEQLVTAVAAAPRWEHPAGSPAAAVAEKIRQTGKLLPEAPNRHCSAVADTDRAAEMAARVHGLMDQMANRPLYTRGVSSLGGCLSTGSSGPGPVNSMEQRKTTPSAATGRGGAPFVGDDLAVVAKRVQTRVWHAWRAQLGRQTVFLPAGTPEERSRSLTGDPWADLRHTIMIALRRSTESELVELLTSNIVQRDQWGNITSRAETIGRLAGWRLWRLINSRRDTHEHRPRPTTPQAPHVTRWDDVEYAVTRRREILARPAAVPSRAQQTDALAEWREQERRGRAARAAAEAEEAALAQAAEAIAARWGLGRYTREPEPIVEPMAALHEYDAHTVYRARAARTEQAAIARAREEKRNRRRALDGLGPVASGHQPEEG